MERAKVSAGSLELEVMMPGADDSLRALQEAIRVSPDNLPLRQHLAETLLSAGRPEEAEKEFRGALQQSPDNVTLKLGLASAFSQQGKDSPAMVIVEDLLKSQSVSPRAYILHARLLLKANEVERAVRQYKRAIEADPSANDPELASRLGVFRASENKERNQSPVVDGKARASRSAPPDATLEQGVERPTITFKDVGGMDALKEEIGVKIIHPLAHADLYKAYGKAIGGGILMYGPPGCGKTYLARATAGEIHAGFIAVGINDVLDMWIGNSERNLHDLFQQARQNKPCVLFFDEVDALASSRADMRTHGGRHVINQFLSELDGVQSSNEGVLILAATNAPWHLDAAFRRPGRFDRILFVPPPDAAARASILRVMLRGKPIDEIDYDQLARKTEHFSGADLKAIVDLAIETKLRDVMKTGIAKPLQTRDLLAAASSVRPSTREWFSTARNYALYSNQGGTYDDILTYLKI